MKHYTQLSLTVFMLVTLSVRAMEQKDLPVTEAFAALTIIDPTKKQPKTLVEYCLNNFGVDDQKDGNNLSKIIYGYTHLQKPVRVPSHLAVLIIEKFTRNFIEEVATQVAPELLTNNLEDETKIAIIKRIVHSNKFDECQEVFQQLILDLKIGNKIKERIKECIKQRDSLFQNMKAFLIAQIYAHKLPEYQEIIEQQQMGMVLSPDGKYWAASNRNIAKIWTHDCKHIAALTDHTDHINSVAWSPNSKYLITGSDDKTAKIWTFKDNQWQCIATLTGHTDWINSVSWSPIGTYIATGSRDKTAKIWTVDCQCLTTLIGHIASIRSVSWSPDGQYIATGSLDETAKIWTLNGQCIVTLSDLINLVAWSPDGKSLTTTSAWDETTKTWDMHLLNTITEYPFSYDEIELIQKIVDAQKSGLTYPLNKQEQQTFDQLVTVDQELGNTLHLVLDPLVNKHKLSKEID